MKTKTFTMSKTYQTTTPESVSVGDFAEGGFEYKNEAFDSLQAMADEINDAGACMPSSSECHLGIWYSTDYIDTDLRTGEQTQYSFHPEKLTDEETKTLHSLINRLY